MWPFRREQERESVPLLLPEPLAAEVDALLVQDQYHDAIKLVRKSTGAGLVVGVQAVDHRRELLGGV
ncbi:hypothetical protein [Demetria terragena]|uniref:hypothetical protein n=1 Tax=Demetria terragena TaxID=63959 RepID=UPI0003624C7A|nr:hypothetical protein [Demetria terragena]